jgi:uncharacterized membrane protein
MKRLMNWVVEPSITQPIVMLAAVVLFEVINCTKLFIKRKIIIVLLFLVYHIKSTGWVKISEQDCTELHYQYEEAERTSK